MDTNVLLTKNGCTITGQIEGKDVSRAELSTWMKGRIRYVEKQLGFTPMPEADAEEMLSKLTKEKVVLSRAEIVQKIGANLAKSRQMAMENAAKSAGKTKNSVAILTVKGLSLDKFYAGFQQLQSVNSPRNLAINIGVCPDHYYLGKPQEGQAEVIETCGNMPVQSDIYVHYGDMDGLNSQRDEDFEYQIAGVGRTADGVFEGGVRHQLKRQADGFIGKFLVEYPVTLPDEYVKQHQMHLICEFSHWILATTMLG